jgi:archaellum component FlaC
METMTVRRGWSDDRIDGLEHKVDEGFRHVDMRFEQVDKQFAQVDKQFDQVNERLGRLEVGIENLRRMMIAFCVGMSGCFAALFTTLLVIVLTQL